MTEAYMVSCITAFTDPESVFIAAALTAAIVIALTIYAFTTKTDFTICGGLLFAALMALFIGGLLAAIFRSRYLTILISAFSVVLFSIYLIYDTQLILGKGELKLTIDDYIFAAMNLYLDIIRIFLEILRLISAARN
jgi:FtsH-binding integral membrane protein